MANKIDVVINFAGKTQELENSLNIIKNSFKNIQISDTIGSDLKKKIEQATEALDNFKRLAGKGRGDQKDVVELNKAYDKLSKLIDGINGSYEKLAKSGNKTLLSKQDLDNFKKLETYWDKVTEAQKESTNKLKEYNKQFKELEKQLQKAESDRDSKQAEFDVNERGRSAALKEARAALKKPRISEEKLIKEAQDRYSYLMNKGEGKLSNLNKQDKEEAKGLKALVNLINNQAKLTEEIKKSDEEAKKLQKSIEGLEKPVFDSNNEAVKQFREELGKIATLDPNKLYSVEELGEIFKNLPDEKVKEIRTQLSGLGIDIEKLVPGLNETKAGVDSVNASTDELAEKNKEIEQLTNRFKQFFSITSGFYLLRRAIRSAYTAVTELDAVMTETAVVTDFTVGDMWKQLPQYTKVANELGVATKDVYKSATLYYQQGLQQQQVEQLNIATLKLARIASLDAAEATDRMTNALRGFNMELNETNANRIADVYSKLAAITAADVDEISTAMTKTASIASSAGMQFETTAAFLSQIIETTRESAETAGTALKTVIARFQELKKAPSEIEEVDGEIIDANKVEGALRTVGISLRDASGQFRELDEVFLELSSKWNSLDKNTQRYIATIAAGSRQQSRFIAMMQNYTHTMELVDAANNAAGASQKQYEKTLESLESKLARLKNAWNEFALTLANSDLIKGVVDLLNNLLTTINKLTGNSGLAKLGVAVGGFLGLKKAAGGFLGFLGSNFLGTNEKVAKEAKKKGELISKVLGTSIKFPKVQFMNENGDVLTGNVSSNPITQLKTLIGLRRIDADLLKQETITLKQYNDALSLGKATISLLGYAAAVAAVTAAVYALYKAWKDNTPEERLKRQEELIKKVEEDIRKDKEELESLKSSLNEISEGQSAFDNLVAGTKEWNEALIKSNGLILDLIDKFPELAEGITRQNGRLILDEDVVERIIKTTEQNIKNRDILSYIDTINKHNLEQQVARRSFGNRFTVNGQNYVDEIAKAYASGRIFSRTDLLNVSKEEGWDLSAATVIQFYDALEECTSSLREFGEELLSENIEDLQAGELENRFIKSLDLSEDKEEILRNLLPNSLVQEQLTKLSDSIVQEWENSSKAGREEMIKQYARSRWGADARVTGDKIYNKNGEFLEKVDKAIVQAGLSQEKNLKEFSETIKNLAAVLPNLRNADLLTQGAKGVKYNDSIAGWGQAWVNNKDILSLVGFTEDIFKEYYNSLYKEAAQVKIKVKPLIDELGEEFGGYSLELLSGLNDKIKEVRVHFGAASADAIVESLRDVPEQVLLELNKVDWSDKAQLQGLAKTLKDLGIASEDTINTIVSQIIELNHATTKLTFEQLTEKMTEFASSIETVKGKIEDGVKTFTQKEFDTLIAAGANASNFVRTGADQYTYGGQTVDLLSTINGNLVELLGDYKQSLQERIAQGERIQGLNSKDQSNLFAVASGGLDTLGWDEDGENGVRANLERLGTAIGLSLEGLDTKQMVDILTEAFNETYGKDGFILKQNLNNLDNQLTSSNQLAYAEQTSGQGMLNLYGQIGDEKSLQAIQKVRIEENKLQVQLNKTTKAFRDNNKEATHSDELLTSLVIDTDKANKKLKVYAEQYSKVKDTLKEANKESKEYQEAASSLMTSAEDIFNFNFTQEFIDNYEDGIDGLIKDLIAFGEGGEKGEQAYLKMGKAIAEARIGSKGLKAAVLETDEYLTALANADYQIKMTGTADLTPIFTALQKAGWSAEQIAQYLNDIKGWHVEFEVDYDKTQWPIFDEFGSEIDYGSIEVPKAIHAVGENLNTGLNFSDITSKGGGGGSSKKENDNDWENPYNKLFNTVERLNQVLRDRNKIEFEYGQLINENADSVAHESKYYKDTLANLQEQLELQKQLQEGYKAQLSEAPIDRYLKKVTDEAAKAAGKERIQQLANYENDQVKIDWSGIEKYKNELFEGGLSDDEAAILKALEETVSYYKEIEGLMDDAEDGIRNIQNTTQEIKESYRKSYIDFENRVIAAIENIRQKEIEDQQELNNAIDSAADDLIGAIRTNIDKMRRDRQNEQTEEELAKKERRLAYLRMDTSGSHNTEILKLEKELKDARIDYADSLVDQSLDEMQAQNDAAAAQRERQITLMEDQLEWDKEHAIIAHEAADTIEKSRNEGYITESSPLYKILYDGEGWGSQSVASLEETLKAVQEGFSKAIVAINEGLVDPYYGDFSKEIDRQINRMLQALEAGDEPLADSIAANIVRLNSARNAKIDQEGLEWKKYNSEELIAAAKSGSYSKSWWDIKVPGQGNQPVNTNNNNNNNNNNNTPNTSDGEGAYAFLDDYNQLIRIAKNNGQAIAEVTSPAYKSRELKPKDWVVTQGGAFQIRGIDANGNYISAGDDNPDIPIPLWAYRKLGGPSYRQYLNGGLADFTGPAWLDGSKAHPEIVLNAQDSANLIQLRDILRNNQNSGTSIGDSYFDIDINVEEISGDYDVDKMADRIKSIIYSDATRYQNYIPR